MDRSSNLRAHLLGQVRRAAVGDRLPTVRWLMREFGLSQVSVQRELAELKASGLIAAEAGRGTFVVGHPSHALDEAQPIGAGSQRRSVLILRRLAGVRRGRVVLDALQRRLTELDYQTLEVAYSDADHARQVLQNLPRFDACVVQNSFETMPIEMLAVVRRKADAIIVDGAWLVGADVDAVGFEWGEPVDRAVALLREQGHRRIGFATTASPFLANELGQHRYEQLRARADDPGLLQPPLLLRELPYQGYEAALVAMLRARADEAGRLPFTELIAWGIDSGAVFRTLLDQGGHPCSGGPVDRAPGTHGYRGGIGRLLHDDRLSRVRSVRCLARRAGQALGSTAVAARDCTLRRCTSAPGASVAARAEEQKHQQKNSGAAR